jgi:nitrate reductase gamma subunit
MAGLDPWLCYYCGDCSTSCPRQAAPGEAMMTLRRYLTAQYDWTGISSKIHRSKAWNIGSLVVVGLLMLLLVAFYHLFVAGMEWGDFVSEADSMGMEHMFGMIATFTQIVLLISLFFLLSNAYRMYRFTMHGIGETGIPFHLYITEAWTFMVHAFTQKRFRECTDKSRWSSHWFLVAAYAAKFIILLFFLAWFQTDNIYPLHHPQRWLGYLMAAAFIIIPVEILISRIKKRKEIHKFSTHSDWIFPIMLLLTALSGLAIHIFRYLGLFSPAHFAYAIHMAISVPLLIIEIPFGKWSHMIYRPLAIYLQTVKEKALLQQLPSEGILDHV